VGEWADWVVLNPQDSALWGVEGLSVVDSWVFASRVPYVRDAFVGGEQVLFEGHHPLEEQVIKEARAAFML
jgi:cytosine/adenosine deaminase-related metal-dependent hydrolase